VEGVRGGNRSEQRLLLLPMAVTEDYFSEFVETFVLHSYFE
jgi:hypothetical protein